MTCNNIRMESSCLCFQIFNHLRVNPVIGIYKQYIITSNMVQQPISGLCHSNIFLVIHFKIGVFGCIFLTDRQGIIRRAIINDDHLKFLVGLRYNTIKALAQKFSRIVNRNQNRNHLLKIIILYCLYIDNIRLTVSKQLSFIIRTVPVSRCNGESRRAGSAA